MTVVFVASSWHRAPLTLEISWVILVREVSFVIHIKRAGSLPVIGGLEAEPHPWTPFPGRETRGQATSEQGFHHLYPCAGSSRKPSVRGPDSSQTREHVRCWEGGAPERPEPHGPSHSLALGTSSSWPLSSCVPRISQKSSWSVPLSSGAVCSSALSPPRRGLWEQPMV